MKTNQEIVEIAFVMTRAIMSENLTIWEGLTVMTQVMEDGLFCCRSKEVRRKLWESVRKEIDEFVESDLPNDILPAQPGPQETVQ